MPYANPMRPKGGRWSGASSNLRQLNPLIVRGLAVQQMRGFVVESLMARGNDEASRSMACWRKASETDDARSYVTFHSTQGALRRWQACHERRMSCFRGAAARRGPPNHRQYYSKVAKAEAPTRLPCGSISAAPMTREALPLILGLMPVLPPARV